MLTPFDIERAFLDAAAGRGLTIRRLIADGRLHRCDAEGRGGKDDGVYILHLDGVPNGRFMDWRDGRGWECWKADATAVLSREQRAEFTAKAERQRRQREAERAAEAEEAAWRAEDYLSRSQEPDRQHPYLVRKGIFPHGVRQLGERLIVPMNDAGRELRGLQWISPDGGKNYMRGTPKTRCAFRIGEPAGVVAIVEGFATGASVHEATGLCTFVAFDADNLAPVAKSVRARMPTGRLVICGDDDWKTPGNPGRSKAIDAAAAVGGVAVFPAFGEGRDAQHTDFNDLAAVLGLCAVREQIETGLNREKREVTNDLTDS